jgi:acetoin utilization protein AcuC
MVSVSVFIGDSLRRYAFGEDHPFGPERYPVFLDEFRRRGLDRRVELCEPAVATQEQIEWFHDHDYVERVKAQSSSGTGMLDWGDTPAFKGVYEAAATVVGTALAGVARILSGRTARVFIPIAGLHHARRDSAAGFCVFNDCGVAIEALRRVHGVRRIAYVDIDAHHGDGVFYGFEDDPDLLIADVHEDGRYLFPGTGSADETGRGPARGTKLNLPMRPGATDRDFSEAWGKVEDFIRAGRPEFILFQCGADGLAGDPITHLAYSEAVHVRAATRLCEIAEDQCQGRVLALGGGGYNLDNLARAWNAVIAAMVETPSHRGSPP